MGPPDRRDPTGNYAQRLLIATILATVAMVVLVIGILWIVDSFPRILPVVIVGALCAAVLLFIYRDRFISN